MSHRVRAAATAALGGLLATLVGCAGPSEVDRVVLITVDTTRADRLGCYGYEDAETPNLDRLASEGVLFEHAVSVVPTTLPAHSSIFTGGYPVDHGVRYNLFRPLGEEQVTLAERLAGAGFDTAAFPASQILHSRFGLKQGFTTWVEPPEAIDRDEANPVRQSERTAGEGVDLVLEWLRDNPRGPQFVWLHLYDPHFAYSPPFPFSSRFRDRPYDGEIAYMDQQIGRLLDELRADDRWSSTAVIVVGDHGEGLYEHDERWHTMLLYETTQRVPLILRVAGVAPRRVGEPVSLVDLKPTILELTGVDPDPDLRGRSVVPALAGEPLERRDLYFETLAGSMLYGWQELRGVRFGDWKLIDSETDPELYNVADDPGETTNLAAIDGTRLAEMRAALTPWVESDRGDADAGAAPTLDPRTLATLESLGYAMGDGGGSAEGAAHPRAMIDLEPELLAAQTAVARGQWERVEDLCRYTLGRDGKNRWALGAMVDALLARGDIEGARTHAELFVQIFPDHERGPRLIATVAMADGDAAAAYRAVTEGLETHPDSEDLRYLSLVAGYEVDPERTCGAPMGAALSRHPNSGRIVVMAARCEAAAGRVDAALDRLRVARERGFRQFDTLRDSEDMAAVVADPAFERLVAGGDGNGDGGDGVGDDEPF